MWKQVDDNPAPVYYQLAAAEYGASGSTTCNSSNGASVGANCIFYDVTLGDMNVDCAVPNCYLADGTVGVLSTSNTAFSPAYGTSTGWDFATGIGTINATNLVNNWPGAVQTPSFTLSASPSSLSIVQGNNGSSTITLTPQNGFSGSVTFSAAGIPNGVIATFAPNPSNTNSSSLTLSVAASATAGTFPLTITGTSGSTTSTTSLSLTVVPSADFSLSASPASLSIVQGTGATSTITINPINGFGGSVNLSASGLPSGVTASFIPDPATTGSTLTLSANAGASTGTFAVTITGTSVGLTHTTTVSLTVTPAPNFSLSASPSSLSIRRGRSGQSTIRITPTGGFNSGVSLTASGLPSGVTASFSPNPATASSTLTLRVSSTATRGTFTVNVTGTSGSLSHATTISLNIHN